MKIALILQYATLLWLVLGVLSVVVALLVHRDQVRTQIFLALSARYDELLQDSCRHFWLSMPPGAALRERSDDLSISALRFCTLVSLGYYLFREHRIPKRMWGLLLSSAERRIRSPLFMREWEHLRAEFDSFPEFVALVTSVQNGTHKRRNSRIS